MPSRRRQRGPDDSAGATYVAVSGSERQLAPMAEVAGDVPPDERIELSVIVRRRLGGAPPVPDATREEREEALGADPADLDAVEQFAHQHGLEVTGRDAARRTVFLAGNAAAVSEALSVRLNRYESAIGGYRGRTDAVYLPPQLAEIVEGVFGLDDRPQARPHLALGAEPALGALSAWEGFSPRDVARIYDFPLELDGSGQCIGIVEFGGGFLREDLDAYFDELGLPAPTVDVVSVDGAGNEPTAPDAAGTTLDGEVMLDVEVVGAVAPNAKIVVYFAPFTERGWVDVLSAAVHDSVNQPSIISISWGWPEGEDLWTGQAVRAVDGVLQDAAALGVTVVCASGNDGSADDIPDGKVHVDFPAASPHVLACGGTTLSYRRGWGWTEAVWNGGPRELAGGASGGGVSEFFPLPAWQRSVRVPHSPSGGKLGRGVPDVAANADPMTGYRIRVRGETVRAGGTSAAAPLWAGLLALVNQHRGTPIGFVNPILYGSGTAREALHDVVVGSNDTTGRLGGYLAQRGWDPCTGMGTPRGGAVLELLTGRAGGPHGVEVAPLGTAWLPAEGVGVDVGIGDDGTVWVVAPQYGAARWTGTGWTAPDADQPALVRVDVGPDGQPWAVDVTGRLWTAADSGWLSVADGVEDVAVAPDGRVWAVVVDRVGTSGVVQWWDDGWHDGDGSPNAWRLSAGPDGVVWVVTAEGAIAVRSGDEWHDVEGAAWDIGVGGDGSTWAIGRLPAPGGYGVFRRRRDQWIAVDAGGVSIAVGPVGLPWITDSWGMVQRRT